MRPTGLRPLPQPPSPTSSGDSTQRIPLNPFWLFVAVALVVLVAVALISYRRSEKQAVTDRNDPGATIRTDAPATNGFRSARQAFTRTGRTSRAAHGMPSIEQLHDNMTRDVPRRAVLVQNYLDREECGAEPGADDRVSGEGHA